MSEQVQPSNRLQAYVKQLTPQARSRLLGELERLHMSGEDIPGSAALLAALRTEFRKGGQAHNRIGDASRHLFQPLEPVLVNTPSADTHDGQISRACLSAIWEWINQALLPTMAREYEASMKSAILADKRRDAEKLAAGFQSKVEKSLESIFADRVLVERTRVELTKFTASASAMSDLEKILRVFKSKNALAKFYAGLPKDIASFKGRTLSDMHRRLDGLQERDSAAVPFALYLTVHRLKQPWQLILLAAHDAHGIEATDVAATPYAYAFPVVLGVLNDRRMKLLAELRQNHVLMAREILAGIYDLERALRTHVDHLEASDWGRQLDRLMELVRNELEAELHKLPDNLHHVLGSPTLHRRTGLGGELSRLIWRLRGTAWNLVPGLLQRGREIPERGVARG
jgi:hypothetical protein